MTKVTREFIKKVLRNYKVEDLTTLVIIKELSKYSVSVSKDSRYSASELYDVIFDELLKNEFIYEVQ